MAPTDRFVPRFAAEPPQEGLPYGRWAHTLSDAFYRASDEIDSEGEDLGEPGETTFYPDRTYAGRTYVPVTAPTSTGLELFGHVSFVPAAEGGEPSDIAATADFTAETAERNPDWQLDLSDDVIGSWRCEEGRAACHRHRRAGRPRGRPVRAGRGPLHADRARRLPRRHPRGEAVRRSRPRGRTRVAVRGDRRGGIAGCGRRRHRRS